MSEQSTCVSIIFNPVSGREDPERRQQAITEALQAHGYGCQFLATTGRTEAAELAQQARNAGAGLILVSGDDGTVMQALSALIGSNIPVAALRAGTGNLLALNLSIPQTLPEEVAVALNGTPQRIDLTRTGEGRYFAISGGIGMDAQLIHDADRASKDRLGKLVYFKSAWQNRLRRRISVSVQIDDNAPMHHRVKTVLAANMGRITGGLQAVPTADPTNGSLEISLVSINTSWEWIRLFSYALLGKTHADPKVGAKQGNRIAIKCKEEQPVQFDREDGGLVKELSVGSVPGAVCILV